MNRRHVTVFSIAALTAASGLLFAGPLTPPSGPVVSSYKTLSDVEPRTIINSTNTPGDAQYEFIISQPGSYYFAGNLNFGGAKHAIKVAADNVTIDMNGYSMVCTATSTGTAITSATVAHGNIRILNGAIRGGFQGGINLWGTASRVERVTVQNTFGDGIWLQNQATLRDCVATANAGYGIVCGLDSLVSGCSSDSNYSGGVTAGNHSIVERCTANSCPGPGADGFDIGRSCTVRDCSANANASFGFSLQGQSRIDNCTAEGNPSTGFSLGQDTQIRGCTARSSRFGISADFGCTIVECQANGCSLDGIHANGDALIQSCHAQNNGQDGINGGFNTTITGCMVNDNSSAGIEISGKGRVEGNDAISNIVGFKATGPGGLFIRNSATSSPTSNYSIAAGNVTGPVVTAGNIGISTNPSSNFSY